MGRRLTKEDFIKRSREIHGDKYDYSKVEYKNTHTKVEIGCENHGSFWQTPGNHFHYGCKICGGCYKLTTQEFIEKAVKVHGEKYNYEKVEYKNNRTKVTIICPKHGEFIQLANSHMGGSGCYHCGYDAVSDSNKISKEEFIQRAVEKHNNKYNYDYMEYVNMTTSILIECPIHGKSYINPKMHLKGSGCRECTNELKSKNNHNRKSTDKFIEELKKVHNNRYDYKLIDSIPNHFTEIEVICDLHGVFRQRYNSHRAGYGCYKCAKTCQYGYYSVKNAERNKSKWENIQGVFYVINVNNEFIKIGIIKNIKRRLKEHKKDYNNMELLMTKKDNLYNLVIFERSINDRLKTLGFTFLYNQKNEIYNINSLGTIKNILENE